MRLSQLYLGRFSPLLFGLSLLEYLETLQLCHIKSQTLRCWQFAMAERQYLIFLQQQILNQVVHYSHDLAMVIVKDNDAIAGTITGWEDIILLVICSA